MKHNIPGPIARKLLALGGCIGALIIFGTVWAIATSDKTILMLSLALLITGTLKIITLYQMVVAGTFEVYEGTITLNRTIPLRKRHELQLVTADGETIQLILSGRSGLNTGVEYRLYVQTGANTSYSLSLPAYLRPARTLLGYEQISTQPLA